MNPKDSYALGIMAVCDAMLGEKRSALESLRKGLELTPADPEMLSKLPCYTTISEMFRRPLFVEENLG